MHQERDGIHYYNAGGWVDEKLTYVTIDSAGVRIHEYREQTGGHGSGAGSQPDLVDAERSRESELLEDAEYENVDG
jgi:hypothetical protein